MQIITSKNSIILKEKVKLNVSVTKHKPKNNDGIKKSITYKINVPKIMLDPILKANKTEFCIIENKKTGYDIYINIFERISSEKIGYMNFEIASVKKNKTSYSITLPRNVVFELLAIDEYLKDLDDIKQRNQIYIYLRLKIDYKNNFKDFTLKFSRKWSGNKQVKQIKKAIKSNPAYSELMTSKLILYHDRFDINEILKFKDMQWLEV